MSERLQDADRAVDEQKRRARRRLVGAVVLAASAAVIVPMLLEKEPQPLGEDVSVQIPPVDEGKFVNRLTRGKGEAPTKADAKAAPTPKAEPPKPETPKTEAPRADAAKAETPNAEPAKGAAEPAASKSATDATASPDAAAPAPAAPAKSVGQAEQRMLAPAPPKSGAPAEAKANVPAKSAPAPAAPAPSAAAPGAAPPAADTKAAPSGSFTVQLAAFSDDKGANALANKLKKAGYASAHVETVDAKAGKLWRVRVGGFATRAEAEAARVKLRNEGFNGMVAPAR